MTENIFEKVKTMLYNARMINGRSPDYIIVGRLTLMDIQANNDRVRYFDYHKPDECKLFGIDVVESFKEHELNVAYKMEVNR